MKNIIGILIYNDNSLYDGEWLNDTRSGKGIHC